MNTDNISKKFNPYLPNIRYNSQSENDNIMSYENNNLKSNNSEVIEDKKIISNNISNENEKSNIIETTSTNYQFTNRSDLFNNKILLNEKENLKKKLMPISYRKEEKNKDNNPFLRKNYSQIDLNNKLDINNNSYENSNNKKDELSNFFGKIKIMNFYSSSEIILLIENIISELNLKNEYSFIFKDSCLTLTFNNANLALDIFKRLNIEKLKNKYFQNLI